jgi:hypothetical protein
MDKEVKEWFFRRMRTYLLWINVSCIWKKVMMSFLSDWWPATSSAESEAFVISRCYEMGDPLAPSEGVPCRPGVEGKGEGGGFTRS